MPENYILNNEVQLKGIVDSPLHFSHESYSEIFYTFVLKVPRLSNIFDYLVVTTSEMLIRELPMKIGDPVSLKGQFRSYNNYNKEGNRLLLTVFASEITSNDDMEGGNSIFLNGYICKPPIYRTTPFGREITDILLAVNRSYNKSDYIPCIAWGRNARFSAGIAVGENIRINGRVQSREYQKKLSEEETITKTAYEVSINKIEHVIAGELSESSV